MAPNASPMACSPRQTPRMLFVGAYRRIKGRKMCIRDRLSGAPKVRAMQLITDIEHHNRGAYGGCIGFIGLDGDLNQAITIRTFVSRGNVLYYQAGAGIVAKSDDERELQEVNRCV